MFQQYIAVSKRYWHFLENRVVFQMPMSLPQRISDYVIRFSYIDNQYFNVLSQNNRTYAATGNVSKTCAISQAMSVPFLLSVVLKVSMCC